MKKFFVFLLFGYFTSFVLQAQNLVCGNVLDPTGDCPGFSGVNIVIKDANGNVICSGLQTGTDGSFCCEVDPSLYPITICAEVNCTDASAINNLDLVLIQHYILGIPGNYPPFIHYAADVNGDGYVNSVDLVEIRKIILGTKTAPNPGFPELCRIINEDCLFQFGSLPWAWHLCIDWESNCTIINSVFGTGDPINFYLFNVGDANESSMDCTKPLWEENIISSRTKSLKMEYGFLNEELVLSFSEEKELNMLVLSLLMEGITMEDIEILDERLDFSLENGALHISYFSNRPDDKIIIKNLFKLKSKGIVIDDKFGPGTLIDASGKLYDLTFYEKIPKPMQDKIFDSTAVPSGQILQIIRPDGSCINVQTNQLYTTELSLIQEKFNLSSGIYFLKIRNETTGQTGNKKIVIFN